MKRIVNIILVVALALTMLCACIKEGKAPAVNKPEVDNEASSPVLTKIANAAPKKSETIKDAMLDFDLKLLKELNDEGKNLFYSAMSINSALTMTYFGANGETRDEMHNALSYGDMTLEDIASAQKAIIKSYEDSGDTTFNTANSIWVDQGLSVKKSYMDTMLDVFNTETYSVDMQDIQTVDKVNSWVNKKTEGMIEKLFEKEHNPLQSAEMVLMNAIYFNGEWTKPFNPDRTYEQEFHGTSGTTKVDMMSMNGDILGCEGDDYKAISLPYGDDKRFSMVLVLPNGDINEFIESQTKDSLEKVLTTFEEKSESIIQIPKFSLEEMVTLNDALKALGMEKAFSSEADFTNIADGLFIDTVLHKAKVDVDEKGTEAAAVTAVILGRGAAPAFQFEFFADKPFLFFIVDGEEDIILFTGKVSDLKQ
jgi:serpin B